MASTSTAPSIPAIQLQYSFDLPPACPTPSTSPSHNTKTYIIPPPSSQPPSSTTAAAEPALTKSGEPIDLPEEEGIYTRLLSTMKHVHGEINSLLSEWKDVVDPWEKERDEALASTVGGKTAAKDEVDEEEEDEDVEDEE